MDLPSVSPTSTRSTSPTSTLSTTSPTTTPTTTRTSTSTSTSTTTSEFYNDNQIFLDYFSNYFFFNHDDYVDNDAHLHEHELSSDVHACWWKLLCESLKPTILKLKCQRNVSFQYHHITFNAIKYYRIQLVKKN